jgi:hypothetical protein
MKKARLPHPGLSASWRRRRNEGYFADPRIYESTTGKIDLLILLIAGKLLW